VAADSRERTWDLVDVTFHPFDGADEVPGEASEAALAWWLEG
jgi:hypothetical protein